MTMNNALPFLWRFCALVTGFMLHLSQAQATHYSFSILNVPTASLGTVAYGLNASGQVAGVFYDGNGTHGFVYTGKDYLTLDVPQATATLAYDINASGQVVGNYIDGTGKHGFLYSNGQYTTLDNPNGFDTNALSINDSGQVAGNFRLGTTGIYGFVYDPRTQLYTTINNPKASAGNTSSTGINDKGEVAGFYYNTGAHGYLYDGSLFTALNAPQAGPAGTFTYALNNQGLMAGVYYDSQSAVNSFVYDGNNYTPFSLPNVKTTYANGINDQGQIVGYITDNTGSHGFLATPHFEPGIIAVQLALRNLNSSYTAGETVDIALQEHSLVRQHALDLWVAIEFPDKTWRYINPESPGLLSSTPKPFKTMVSTDNVQHAIARFVIAQGLTGHYRVYAIFNEPGRDLSNLAQTLRSNIATAEIDLR
jgi:probable HAF family extracellular repeat protein